MSTPLSRRAGTKTLMIEIGGVRGHVERAGRGRPLVLLHGLGASSYSWRFAVPALAESFDLIVPDLPGFGRSDKPRDFDYSLPGFHRWIAGLLERLGLRSALFAGNSMGGSTILWIALESPALVERMALLGTPGYPQNMPKALAPLSWPVVGRVCEFLLREPVLRSLALSTFVDKSKVTEEMVAEYGAALRTAAGRRAVAEFMRRALPPDWRERVACYPKLRQPALVLVGDSDGMVAEEDARRLSRELGNAVFRRVESCGHAPQEDAPDKVLPLVREFLLG